MKEIKLIKDQKLLDDMIDYHKQSNNLNVSHTKLDSVDIRYYYERDISKKDIHYLECFNVDFIATKFNKCTFKNCTFIDCCFYETHFEQCAFENCIFKNCNMDIVKFNFCIFHTIVFDIINFNMCGFEYSNLYKTQFIEISMKYPAGYEVFRSCSILASEFMKTDMSNIMFDNTKTEIISFINCTYKGVKIKLFITYYGLYKYDVAILISTENKAYVKLGCLFGTKDYMQEVIYRPTKEFPVGSIELKRRINAYYTLIQEGELMLNFERETWQK